MSHPDQQQTGTHINTPQHEQLHTGTEATTLAEDLLLLLYQPASGTIAGESTLYYVLAGAVLADLALSGHITTSQNQPVTTTRSNPPSDPILRSAWNYISEKPRGVQTLLAAIGPTLRSPLLERLIKRGDMHRETRKILGLFNMAVLREGSGRRAKLVADVRRVLVDGAEPTPPVAALAALLSASGTLPQFDREIPWTSPVIARAAQLEQGNWGAEATAEAVTRTVMTIILIHVLNAATCRSCRR